MHGIQLPPLLRHHVIPSYKGYSLCAEEDGASKSEEYVDLYASSRLQSEEYTARVAETVEEACKLIEAGFGKVDEFDKKHIYRKRK